MNPVEATVQSIFRDGFDSYQEQHGLSVDQTRAAQAIMLCQSEALGDEEWVCVHDGHTEYQNHSCRHRSCPRYGDMTHGWSERTQAQLLPGDHYHVIFTLPMSSRRCGNTTVNGAAITCSRPQRKCRNSCWPMTAILGPGGRNRSAQCLAHLGTHVKLPVVLQNCW